MNQLDMFNYFTMSVFNSQYHNNIMVDTYNVKIFPITEGQSYVKLIKTQIKKQNFEEYLQCKADCRTIHCSMFCYLTLSKMTYTALYYRTIMTGNLLKLTTLNCFVVFCHFVCYLIVVDQLPFTISFFLCLSLNPSSPL